MANNMQITDIIGRIPFLTYSSYTNEDHGDKVIYNTIVYKNTVKMLVEYYLKIVLITFIYL